MARVRNATLMAVSSPTVVPDASSIFWTSLWRVLRAVWSAEFDEWLWPAPGVHAAVLVGSVIPSPPKDPRLGKVVVGAVMGKALVARLE